MTDSDRLLDLAVTLAQRAGALLMDRLHGDRTDIVSKSSPTDLVSEVDLASERLIVEALRSERPDDAVIAEEGTADAGASGLRWVVDPLDGTINYLYHRPGFSVSIGCEDDAGGLVGVVFDPFVGELFTAVRGGGAYRNGEPIHCNTPPDLAHALVGTGFGYEAARRAYQSEVLRSILPVVRDIRRGGAATLDLCSVACGRADAYFEKGLAPWDHAAAALIAAEAGAVVGDLRGGPPTGDMTVAAPQPLFDRLVALLVELNADAGP